MENRFVQTAFKVYFMAIAVLMYYFLTEVINLGLFVTYRHAFALVLFFSAVVLFIFGTRGPIICVAAFLIALVILKIIKSEKSAKKLLLSAAVIVFIILLFDEDNH